MDHRRTLIMVRWVQMIQEVQTVRKDISCTSLWVGGELSDQPLIHWGKTDAHCYIQNNVNNVVKLCRR